jgi:hypothetical protein
MYSLRLEAHRCASSGDGDGDGRRETGDGRRETGEWRCVGFGGPVVVGGCQAGGCGENQRVTDNAWDA